MPRTPEPIKRRIMSSEEYHEWVRNRVANGNVPADLFRAYQIDKSLSANLKGKEEWSKQVNRGDIVPVDYPLGSVRPDRPQVPTHRPTIAHGGRKPPATALGRELKWRAKEVSHRYKVPLPEVRVSHRESSRRSRSVQRIDPYTHEPKQRGQVIIGIKDAHKGVARDVMMNVFYHELGHHVDAYLGYQKTGKMNK